MTPPLTLNRETLFRYVDKLTIDKKLARTPGRAISKAKIVYPDHYALILKFKDIPLRQKQNLVGPRFTTWNTNKEGGWNIYKEITNDDSKLATIGQEVIEDATRAMKKVDKELEKCKFQAFGKVSVRKTPLVDKHIDSLFQKKSKLLENEESTERDSKVKELENEIASKLVGKQRENLEKEIAALKDVRNKKGKAAAVFNLKERVLGSTKAKQEAAVIRDPATGKIVTDVEEIKNISLKYCVDLLTNRPARDGYKELIQIKKNVHEKRMKEVVENDVEFSEDLFDKCVAALKKRNPKKYKFICNAGGGLRKALLPLFRYIWTFEDKPDQWRRTTLIQLHKKKSKEDLNNYRNIHTKIEIPKLFGFMVTSLAKVPIIQKMSKFQIGTVPGHRSQEHLFVLRNVVSLYKHHKQPLILQLYDIQKFFDKEMLVDGLDAIYNSGVKDKLYRLLDMLNKGTIIQVKTGVGLTEEAETGENIGQGTGEGAIISAASISDGIEKAFKFSTHELSYGEEELRPLLFQNNIARICDSAEAAQAGNDLVSHVMESKLLDFNINKSCYMVVGDNKSKTGLIRQLEASPLSLAGFPTNQLEKEKYLGDLIHCNGNSDSVTATVDARTGPTISAIFETKSVIEDCRSDAAGGLCLGLEIWELSILPYLLNNCAVWADTPKGVYKKLNDLQNRFYRYLFATPSSTPIPSLLWDVGGLTMENRIKIQKLNFYHHLVSLETEALASKITKIAEVSGYPGLIQQYKQLCMELKLPDPHTTAKQAWKRQVKRAVTEVNKNELLSVIREKYEKLDYETLKSETFSIQEYLKTLNVNDARLKFKIRCKMVKTIALNFPSDTKYSNKLWQCTHCDMMDSQSHILLCASYKHMREGKNLHSDRDLVQYFREVISLREKLELII